MDNKRIEIIDIDDNDYCDLDPTKICDNCCKCLENDDDDFRTVAAKYDETNMRIFYSETDAELPDISIPDIDIDPALMEEWNARLKAYEEQLKNDDSWEDEAHITRHDSAKMYGVRKKRKN